MEELINQTVLCPVIHESPTNKKEIVAWFKGKIVSAKKSYGRIDCLVQPIGGKGAVPCSYSRLEKVLT